LKFAKEAVVVVVLEGIITARKNRCKSIGNITRSNDDSTFSDIPEEQQK
jgi:hypothetical protein